MKTRDDCLALDTNDQIAALRDAFDLPDDVIYLDGNSLGAKPKAASARVQHIVEQEWREDLIRSWNQAGWFNLPHKLGMQMLDLLGAWPGEVVVTDTTSINLFKALACALHLQTKNKPSAKKIITECSNFPSDIYIAQGISSWLDKGFSVQLVDTPEELETAIDGETAVVLLTHVNYRTGYQFDMQAITELAHQHGALMIWDLAHSAGAVPLDLHQCGADMAVGCTYKYLNGGPGAPAFIWVHNTLLPHFQQPLTGWWGHTSPFEMSPEFTPTMGIGRALCGTQGIISMALVECGLDVFARTDMRAIRSKSLALTDLFIELVEQECANHPLQLITPREHARRGSQVSYQHPHAFGVMQALIERGVIGDYREPEIMRFGFTPLYTRFVDVWDAVATLKEILEQESYDAHAIPHSVT